MRSFDKFRRSFLKAGAAFGLATSLGLTVPVSQSAGRHA